MTEPHLIVLVNRIYLTIEDAFQRQRLSGNPPQVPNIQYCRADYSQPIIFQLDADNDGEDETIIPSYEYKAIITIFDHTPTGLQPAVVDDAASMGAEIVEGVALADIDNDGLNEIVCVLG